MFISNTFFLKIDLDIIILDSKWKVNIKSDILNVQFFLFMYHKSFELKSLKM